MIYDLEHDDLLQAVKEDNYADLEDLCQQIRDFLIDKISKTGGLTWPQILEQLSLQSCSTGFSTALKTR